MSEVYILRASSVYSDPPSRMMRPMRFKSGSLLSAAMLSAPITTTEPKLWQKMSIGWFFKFP